MNLQFLNIVSQSNHLVSNALPVDTSQFITHVFTENNLLELELTKNDLFVESSQTLNVQRSALESPPNVIIVLQLPVAVISKFLKSNQPLVDLTFVIIVGSNVIFTLDSP